MLDVQKRKKKSATEKGKKHFHRSLYERTLLPCIGTLYCLSLCCLMTPGLRTIRVMYGHTVSYACKSQNQISGLSKMGRKPGDYTWPIKYFSWVCVDMSATTL